MKRTRFFAVLCLALAAGALASPPVLASDHGRDRDREQGRGGERAMEDRAISLDEAVARAERRHNARAVRAEVKRRDDRIVYRIRLLDSDGRVFEVMVDAGTGEER